MSYKNIEKRNEKQRERYHKNKEKHNLAARKWALNNKEKVREIQRKSRKNNQPKLLLNNCKNRSRIKGFDCNLTIDWVKENITSKSCIYCGETHRIGCDRIDNSKGYTIDNVIPCCGDCNRIRSNKYSVEETIRFGELKKQILKDRNK